MLDSLAQLFHLKWFFTCQMKESLPLGQLLLFNWNNGEKYFKIPKYILSWILWYNIWSLYYTTNLDGLTMGITKKGKYTQSYWLYKLELCKQYQELDLVHHCFSKIFKFLDYFANWFCPWRLTRIWRRQKLRQNNYIWITSIMVIRSTQILEVSVILPASDWAQMMTGILLIRCIMKP